MNSPTSAPPPALRLLEKRARGRALPPVPPPPAPAWWVRWLTWATTVRR